MGKSSKSLWRSPLTHVGEPLPRIGARELQGGGGGCLLSGRGGERRGARWLLTSLSPPEFCNYEFPTSAMLYYNSDKVMALLSVRAMIFLSIHSYITTTIIWRRLVSLFMFMGSDSFFSLLGLNQGSSSLGSFWSLPARSEPGACPSHFYVASSLIGFPGPYLA